MQTAGMPTTARENSRLRPQPTCNGCLAWRILTLRAENQFLPNLREIPGEIARRAKLFYVNYPNNPTGAIATYTFFDELIDFAQAHNVLVVQDAAYATLAFSEKPCSILSRPGGKAVAIELHSMSKAYNMTGWRLGFVAGGEPFVKAFAEVKDNCDSGQFKAVQVAAAAGLADLGIAQEIMRHYERRLKKMVTVLRLCGFAASMPGGTFYLYVPAPKGSGTQIFATAEEASQHLIREYSIQQFLGMTKGPSYAFLPHSRHAESKMRIEC